MCVGVFEIACGVLHPVRVFPMDALIYCSRLSHIDCFLKRIQSVQKFISRFHVYMSLLAAENPFGFPGIEMFYIDLVF